MAEGAYLTPFFLPGGYADDTGEVHREGALTALSGREEELLAERSAPTSAALVTALLSRCVRRIGTISPITETIARQLLVADRQYLLLQLRAATFGNHVQATVECPWQECGKKVDIDFSLQDVPVRESVDTGPLYHLELSPEAAFSDAQGEVYQTVTFRLPNGTDQEHLTPHIAENEAAALALLLGRCIRSIGPIQDPGPEVIQRLSPVARLEIERQMETLAPQLDLAMEVACPECSREFTVPFDLQDFFLAELHTSRELLYREVHYLAYHYHWSEQEIMAMPREKRRKYIAVLVEEMERMTHAV